MRSSRRLQRYVGQAGDLAKGLLETPHELKRALGAVRVL
jgi:hypothetical protein